MTTIKQKLLAGATILLLSGSAFAMVAPKPPGPGTCPQAPEINVGSGTNALVLLVGGLLLAGEKYRSSRQS